MEVYRWQPDEACAHSDLSQETTVYADDEIVVFCSIPAAKFVGSAEGITAAKRQINAGRKDRVQNAVCKHLRSPILRPATLCRLVGMSRSNLYRLLDDAGGVARYIQTKRLLEARTLLSCPSDDKPISAIAEELCFADASSFTRAFKREFGRSPSEVRLHAQARSARSSMALNRASSRSDHSEINRDSYRNDAF